MTTTVNEQYKLLGRKVEDKRQSEDFYPTPSYVTEALLEYHHFRGKIWEPACGDGRMAEVLKKSYQDVECSDLMDRGYGQSGVDFLKSNKRVANIVTNPPFQLAYEFIEQGLKLADDCLALLLPIRYLTGKKRAKLYTKFPPAKIIVIPNKVDFLGFGSPAMEFAWFSLHGLCGKEASNKLQSSGQTPMMPMLNEREKTRHKEKALNKIKQIRFFYKKFLMFFRSQSVFSFVQQRVVLRNILIKRRRRGWLRRCWRYFNVFNIAAGNMLEGIKNK